MSLGRFDPQSTHQPMADINVTPLVDVMLVLLVIFIIAAPLMTGALSLALPSVDAPPQAAAANALEVTLDSQGGLRVDGQALPVSQLAAALQLRGQAASSTEVQLKVDKDVAYGQVAEVMAEIQKSDFRQVALAVQTAAPKIPASPPARN